MSSTLDVQASRYPEQRSGLQSSRYDTASLGTSYVMTERLVVSLYGTAARLHAEERGQDTKNQSASLQAKYVWSPQSSISASIGQSWVRSGTETNRGLLYSFAASHAFETSTIAFSMSRRESPSGLALLTEADETHLDFSTQLTERLSANASASYSKRRNVLRIFDVDLQRVRYSRADLGLSWRMSSTWRLGASVGAARQQVGSVFLIDDLTARGYDAHLGFSWNGDPYVR